MKGDPMKICVPILDDGQLDLRWGRAERVAVADLEAGEITGWQEVTVSWDQLHDTGTDGAHHARVVRFLREQGIEAVVAHHMGDGMLRTLHKLGLQVSLGASGDARAAVRNVGSGDAVSAR